MLNISNTENVSNTYVIKLDLKHCLLPEDYKTIFNLLFCRRLDDRDCNIRRLTNSIATTTKVRRTFHDDDDEYNNETIIIYYAFNQVEIPRFTSELISVYNKNKDKSIYERVNKNHFYHTVGSFKIRILSLPEQHFIKHQLEDYIEKNKEKGIIKICN